MATETVSAFTPVSLGFNKDAINGFGIKCENDLNFDEHTSVVTEINSPIAQSYYKRMSDMTGHEFLTARERDQIQEMQRVEKTDLLQQENIKLENVNLENVTYANEMNNGDSMPNNIDKQDDDPNMMGKKKRNAKKRNRSDMPPEELMRLRERERKAQQSRRDRIRAQKRHAQGWHDDDAAWEAFLDQAENNTDSNDDQMKPNFNSSLPPSMVCSISSRSSPKDDEMFANDISPDDLNLNSREVKDEMKDDDEEEEEEEHIVNGNNDIKKVIQKQDSVHSNDTDTNSAGSYIDNQSVHYSSDDKPMDGPLNDDQKENGKKKLSRRHYLPSDELERLRKRERETKRRQREKHRLANMESSSPVKSNSTLSSNDAEYIEEVVNESEIKSSEQKKYDILTKSEHFKTIDQHHTPPPTDNNNIIPLVVPPKPMLSSSESHLVVAVPPSTHHVASNHHRHYPSLVYMSNTTHHHHHHHYPAHSPTQYLREGRHLPDIHYPRYLVDDRHYHSDSYKLEGYHKNHVLPHMLPTSSHRPPTSADGMSSPEHKAKQSASTSPTNGSIEKKKMISRNVDRKKLSEEELEELRRRERDYQRERRARIRMEKAKSQANHEQYSQKPRDDGMSHYYHPSSVYPPHSALHMYHDDLHHRDRENPIHVIPNCDNEERFDYRQYSPHCHTKNTNERERKELAVSIATTDSRYERKQLNSSDEGKENDLLQVVPKTRECEEMSASPPQVTPNKNNSPECGDSKKSLLENICSTLKKDTDDWQHDNSGSYYGDNDDNDDCDDKLVIVQPNTCQDKDDGDNMKVSDDHVTSRNNVTKEELTNGTTIHNVTSVKSSYEMSLRDRIMEEQLERRRRSNREAQRRRRARLKIQESSEDRPDSADEILDYELYRGSKSMHIYNDDAKSLSNHVIPKGCRLKITPQMRPDSLYSDDYHGYHSGHHNGKLPYNNHAYDRYAGHGHVQEPHQVEKHCYYSSHRSSKEIDSHRYPHYFREQSKIERYIHELPLQYGHHGNPTTHEYNDRKKCARVPSIDGYDHHDEVVHRNEVERNMEKQPHSTSNSPSKLSTPKLETDNELEPSKQCGRKRKQYAPRKVISTSNSPEEDVDVCTVGESPEEKSIYKETPVVESCTKILQLNGDVNYENISSQHNLDDLYYLHR